MKVAASPQKNIYPAEPLLPFLIRAKLSFTIKRRHTPALALKFESRDEWLGIRD